MLRLPAKQVRIRSGILRVPEREWPKHQRFVRSHCCSVPGCPNRPVRCCHLRTAANSGMRQKPHDWFTVPLCDDHHGQQEGRTKTFERKYGIDLWAIAAELARKSPDIRMKEVMNHG